MTESRIGAVAVAIALVLGHASARADDAPASEDPSLARSRNYFEQARKLADAGQWIEACPLFQEAHDEHATGGTALQLANCYEKIGKPDRATVYYRFIVVHRATETVPDRVHLAEQRLAALEPHPEVAAPAGAASASTGSPAPTSRGARPPMPALIAFGAGGAGLVVGAIFGGLAVSQASSVKAACDGNVCPASERDAASAATTKGWVSTVGFGAAFVGLSVGAVLWVVDRQHRDNAPPRAGAITADKDGVSFSF